MRLPQGFWRDLTLLLLYRGAHRGREAAQLAFYDERKGTSSQGCATGAIWMHRIYNALMQIVNEE